MKVLTYNVLADVYVKSYFERSPRSLLVPGARTAPLIKRIDNENADVVCLQEVEKLVFDRIASELDGYDGYWKQKGRGKHDGCATFSRLPVRDFVGHEYFDKTGHVVLVAIVELDGKSIAVANTHLRWSRPETPAHEHNGVVQLRELLRMRSTLAPGLDAWVVCGDFNAPPGSIVTKQLIDAGFRDAFASESDAFTCNSSGVAKRIDFVFASSGLAATAHLPPTITDTTILPSNEEPSDHLPICASISLRALPEWACAACDHHTTHDPVCAKLVTRPNRSDRFCDCGRIEPMLPELAGHKWMFSHARDPSYDPRDVVEVFGRATARDKYGSIDILIVRLRDDRWLCCSFRVYPDIDDFDAVFKVADSLQELWWFELTDQLREVLADHRTHQDLEAEKVWLDELLDSPDPEIRAKAEALAERINRS